MTIPNTAYSALSSLPLMIWLSPAFPVGGFAYSHALEWAVAAGDLPDADALQTWLRDLITHGAIRNDAVLLSAALQAARDADVAALAETNELALALAGSRERFIETSAQGAAFMIAIRAAWGCDRMRTLEAGVSAYTSRRDDPAPSPPPAVIPGLVPGTHGGKKTDVTALGMIGPGNKCRDDTGGEVACEVATARPYQIAYPVAVGLAAGAHVQDLGATLDAYLTATISNLTSAAIRLSVIGQTDAQRIIMQSLPAIRELSAFATLATLDDVGGCAFRSDIASMRHETQVTRLFRT
ncbi:MAG: urease accessory UreF family protein [Hyphomicrobiaceae bacterium]